MLYYCRPADLHHSQSETFRQLSHTSFGVRQDTGNYDELVPPPPPPVFEDDSPRNRSALNRVIALDTMATGTSKSTASAASFTLASNASVFSSQTDESEEEGGRRKVQYYQSYTTSGMVLCLLQFAEYVVVL